MTALPVRAGAAIAQTGMIVGGPLHGWHYAFLEFQIVGGQLAILARCTRPKWPFPKEVRFIPELGHVRQFRSIPGQRAKRIEVAPLIEAAYAAEPGK